MKSHGIHPFAREKERKKMQGGNHRPPPPGEPPLPTVQAMPLWPINYQDIKELAQEIGANEVECGNQLIRYAVLTFIAEKLKARYCKGELKDPSTIPPPLTKVPDPEEKDSRTAEQRLKELQVEAGLRPAEGSSEDEPS